jgi:hypothetical protein
MLERLPLPELRPAQPPPRSELLARLASRLHLVIPEFRPVAEDLLADVSRMDVFGVGGDGSPVLALLGDAGDDLTLVARALAQREWLAPRVDDWLKLAPDLGLRPGASVQAIVLCPEFGPEARAAVRGLEPGTVRLVAWRYLRNGSDAGLLLENITTGPARTRSAPPHPAAGFRTGLAESDLGLSDEERADFE